MQRHIFLIFGTPQEHQSYLVGVGDDPVPGVGHLIDLHLANPLGDTVHITGEVRYRTWIPGEPLQVYVYGGPVLPPEQIRLALVARGCAPVEENLSQMMVATVLNSPTVAFGHDVMLVVGNQENYEIWQHTSEPADATVPVFGQRLLLPVTEMNAAPWSNLLNKPAKNDHLHGLVLCEGVVFYTAKSDSGQAQVGVHVGDTSTLTGFDLLAAGWVKLSPEAFDVQGFRTWSRVDLAHRTHLFEVDHGDEPGIDFEMTRPGDVSEHDMELLPLAMRTYCQMQQAADLS